MKKLIFLLAIGSIARTALGQNEDDALRYSQIYFGGSARNMGMAGALSALGGDYSNVLSNPAGLARFKKDNFSFTLNIENPHAATDFYGSPKKYSGFAGNVNNFSYIRAFNLDPNKQNNWFTVTMGLGVNRIASFQDRFEYSGLADSSILHSFINEANGISGDELYTELPFSGGLAWDTYAINPDPFLANNFVTDFSAGQVFHDRVVKRKGGMTEYNLNVAGNYANKFFIGGSLNPTRINYNETFTHTETSAVSSSIGLNSISYTGNLDIGGWGWNARVGAIALPVDWFRVGLAFQTPSFFRMNDFWSNNMSSSTDSTNYYIDNAYIPTGSYTYNVRTPFRANASVGVVLKKLGSVGAEIEFVDYRMANLSSRKFSAAPYSFSLENSQIENLYRSAFNYKIGLEARITPEVYLRGGFAYFPSPFKANKGNTQFPTSFYTGGLGYNFGNLYFDFAVVVKAQTRDYYAYDPSLDGSHATINMKNAQYLFTVGYRFK